MGRCVSGSSRGGGGGSKGGNGGSDANLVEIARITTFATSNNKDIVRRLMGTSKSFKGLSFADAMQTFRTYERDGLVKRGDGYLVVYHDTADPTKIKKRRGK